MLQIIRYGVIMDDVFSGCVLAQGSTHAAEGGMTMTYDDNDDDDY